MRIAINILGVLFLVVGCIWFLQGISVLPGSFMSGQRQWAIYGALLGMAGLALLNRGRRR